MLSKLKNIQYKKLISTFFAHIFVASLYGSFLGLYLQEELKLSAWVSRGVMLGIITLVVYVAYQEEVKRYYPFSKALGVNFFGFVLWFGVAFTKVYALDFAALVMVLFAIKYKCKKCVEYKRFAFV